MCGILGQLNKNYKIDKGQFEAMLATLERRGPDDSGIFHDGNIALGHRRLSIIDPSQNANQPMASEDGNIILVFNGEIYNHKEIKESLGKCHIWKSNSDSEAIIHGYEQWGIGKLLKKIEGMFAFAIFDKKKKKIFLARDHFGEKPVYYFLDSAFFCFASELKAILKNRQIGKKLSVDPIAPAEFLVCGYIPSPRSIYKEIKKLEPASFIEFDINKWKLSEPKQFWNLEKIEAKPNLKESLILPETESLIQESVKRRLVSDTTQGVFLSGGLDSSLIAHYAREIDSGVEAFTLEYDETNEDCRYARVVAQKLGLIHNRIKLQSAEVGETFLEIFEYLDEPLADAAIVPLYFLAKHSRGKIRTALGGDGGDEIFAGYEKYRAQLFIEKNKFPGYFAPALKYLFGDNDPKRRLFEAWNQPFWRRQMIFGSGGFLPEELNEILKNPADQKGLFVQAGKFCGNFQCNDICHDILNKSLCLDCKMQIPDWYMQKSDRAAMATSLEIRSPFLDKKLAEFMFSVPGKFKIKNDQKKYLLKKIAEKYLPKELVQRKKSGFQVPLDRWIRNELKDVFSQYIFAKSEHLNEKYVRRLYNDHMSGKRDHRFRLLRIFALNYWKEKYYRFEI